MLRIRIALVGIYSAGLALLCCYVPWTAIGDDGMGGKFSFYFGHNWLWRRPIGYAVIDMNTLLVSIAFMTAVFVAAMCFTLLSSKAKQ